MAKRLERLSKELEEQAIQLIEDGETLKDTAKKIGLKSSGQFYNYQSKFPDFKSQIDDAFEANCRDLEDQLLRIPMKYSGETLRQLSTNIMKVLEYRSPKRYSQKFQHDMNVTFDLSQALKDANQRVIDVTNTNVILLTPKLDDE